jgi:precorrin-4/cobalt-precorrin-4 C11-methyltransferase
MTVHFIGAGPGAPDLITVRGRDLIARCPVCLYAGSLVPQALLTYCPPGARIIDTAPLSLDQIEAEFQAAHEAGLGIAYTVTPGVPSFAAAAATLGQELTLPGVAQSVVLTRTTGRASAMPERETLTAFAATGATLAIHLSIHVLDGVIAELTPFYGADCAVAVVYRASWPDERAIRGTLATIAGLVAANPIERTALILVGPALASRDFRESALYDPDYLRRFRPDRTRRDQ